MLTNEQFREGKVNQVSRANYFRSYNQLPHRKEYLKRCFQVRKLLKECCNLSYQSKGDRHKLTRSSRYQLETLTRELNKRGWIESNSHLNPFSQPYLFFNCCIVDKKSPQTSYIYKSIVFLYAHENLTHQQKQEAYQFAYLVQKESQQLSELLFKKPLLFKKKLKEIEKTSQAVSQHWKKQDIIQTINQIPQEKEWQLPTYYQKQDLSALLLKYQEAGGKNKLVLDFDHYKKDEKGNFLMSEQQRKEVDTVIDYLINYWKLPWYEVSKSGARKLHLNIDELPMKSKLWWKLLVIGDILGKGSQTTLPLSKGRRVEFSKWSENGAIAVLPEIKLKNWEQGLAKFSLSSYDKRELLRRDFAEVNENFVHYTTPFSTNEKQILPTVTTTNLTSEKQEGEPFLSTIQQLRKELGYYGEKTVKVEKFFTPQYVERLGEKGGSRGSEYYWVGYLDELGERGGFLVDKGWREREFKKVMNNPSSVCLRVGEVYDFLVRGVGGYSSPKGELGEE